MKLGHLITAAKDQGMDRILGLSGLTALGQLTYFAVSPFIFNRHGPENLGIFFAYLALVNLIGGQVSLRLELGVFRKGNEDRSEDIVFTAAIVALIVAVAAYPILYFVGNHLAAGTMAMVLANPLLLVTGFVLTGVSEIVALYSVWQKKFLSFGILRLIQYIIISVLQFSGVFGFSSVNLIYGHIIGVAIFVILMSIIVVKTPPVHIYEKINPKIVWANLKKEVRHGMFNFGSLSFRLANANLPMLVISAFFSSAIVGQVGAAYRLLQAPLRIVAGPLGNWTISNVSHGVTPAERFQKAALGISVLSGLLIAPATVVWFLFPVLIEMLMGPEWELTGEIGRILIIYLFAEALFSMVADTLSVIHLERRKMAMEILGFILVQTPLFLMSLWLVSINTTFLIFAIVAIAVSLLKTGVTLHIVRATRMETDKVIST